MRLPMAVVLTLAPLIGCAHPGRPLPAALQQTTLGTPDAFGGGIVAMSPRTVTVELTAPAHVMVVRVFDGDSAQLAYPLTSAARGAREPLQPGASRLELWRERARDRVPDLRARGQSLTEDENACRMRRAMYEATRPRDTLNPRPPTPFWDSCISRPNSLDVQPAWTTALGAPIPPGPHYLVVIATDASLEPSMVAERLSQLDISRENGDAAARSVPEYLLDARARWAAWVVHRP